MLSLYEGVDHEGAQARVAGTFKIAGSDAKADGTLELENGQPKLCLVAGSQKGSPQSWRLGAGDGEFTIHGVGDYGRLFTVLGCRVTAWHYKGGYVQSEVSGIIGDYILYDAHVQPIRSAAVRGVRVRIPGMEHWISHRDGWVPTREGTGGHPIEVSSVYDPRLGATISVQRSTTLANESAAEFRAVHLNWVELVFDDPTTINCSLTEVVEPLANLLAVLSHMKLDPPQVEIMIDGDLDWHDLHGRGLTSTAAVVSQIDFLHSFDTVKIGGLASWLVLANELHPIPQIVASNIAENSLDRSAQTIMLCLSLEGLHRRLFPGSRRFTTDEVAAGKEALRGLVGIPDRVRKVIEGAMSQHIHEPSFPSRLVELVRSGGYGVTADLVGNLSHWKSAVTNYRNSYAHQLQGVEDFGTDMLDTINFSLKGLAFEVLMRRIGVPRDAVFARMTSSPEYRARRAQIRGDRSPLRRTRKHFRGK